MSIMRTAAATRGHWTYVVRMVVVVVVVIMQMVMTVLILRGLDNGYDGQMRE
jgi:hypothetical protein